MLGEDSLLYFADVCAGPGGFSEYVLWRKRWRSKGFGFTLKGKSDFKLEDFYAGTRKFEVKVEKILKGSLDSIPSPSPSGKIQIMGGKVCLRCKGKILLGVFVFKSLLTSPCNVLPLHLKQTFPPMI